MRVILSDLTHSSSLIGVCFSFTGLSHNVFKGITRKGYKIPTPIQRKVFCFFVQ